MKRIVLEVFAFFAMWAAFVGAGFMIPQLFDRDVAGALWSTMLAGIGAIAGPIIAISGIIAVRMQHKGR